MNPAQKLDAPTTKLGRVTAGRYAIVEPHEADEDGVTAIIPPDDRSFDLWMLEWNEEFRKLRAKFIEKVREVAETGVQGKLGLTGEANERTPSQAVSLLALNMIKQKRELSEITNETARTINTLLVREQRVGGK